MLLDHPIISERYFFPRAHAPNPDHRLDVRVDGATLACARWDNGAESTLVHFHGNGEVVADWENVFPSLAKRAGVNLLLAEYRGYGASTGEPLLGKMLDDVAAIASAAGGPVVVFGRSVGSIYAVELATRCDAIGLVLESGIASPLQRILLRVTPEELGADLATVQEAFDARLNHQEKLGAFRAPLLVLHAENDHLVGVEHAHANAGWAAGEVEMRIFERGDHNSIFAYNRGEYEDAVVAFIRRCLNAEV